MTEQQLREEMVQIGASLFSRGYATGSAGNLSLLLPDGNLLATPTGACLGELQAQRLSVGHCCKVSDEAAFCLIQRPYISKTLLTRRISPRGSP